jgi:hypothetical protein
MSRENGSRGLKKIGGFGLKKNWKKGQLSLEATQMN